MKALHKAAWIITITALFASCQSNTDVKQILSNSDTRTAIMESIADDSTMSEEMMDALMNNKNRVMQMHGNEKMAMLMVQHHNTMMKVMKDNPEMMQQMMSDMMEVASGDTTMMSGMYKAMMNNQHKGGMKEGMKQHH